MRAPTLEDVKAALRDGRRMQIGGGRIFHTWTMTADALVVVHSDDGYTTELPSDDASLREAIAGSPEVFAQYVAWWREGR